jgi:uncharacterized membrane protein YkvA (DUF1232 family)
MATLEPLLEATWTERVQRLRTETHVFYLVLKHPRTRWYARLVAAGAAGYVLSPIQLIPNFIPVIGTLDDMLVLFVGAKLLKIITPSDVLAECRERAKAAANLRKEIKGAAAFVTPIVVVTVWILAAITASALMATYIYR